MSYEEIPHFCCCFAFVLLAYVPEVVRLSCPSKKILIELILYGRIGTTSWRNEKPEGIR
ncbi:hypothetical protein B4110_0645 [Parageobacillus toebii]|uniref:Uncharacterized protein n=1 Tax=Parageobacillus toebii TaxID=153151 RepID=A0A150MJI4_9BACL|nr:hypothetical protein B4110_0645 [Parageobacillus toebii]